MVDNRKVKIYVLKHPDTLEVRYVGKTVRSLSRRLGNHIANAKGNKHNKHLSNWILKILSTGKRPIIELIEECDSDNWEDREKYWISHYTNLINLTEGGDGCLGFMHDTETRKKCGLASTGRKHTKEFRENMNKRLKNKPLSAAHRSNISRALKGRKLSDDFKRKLSESHLGIPQSEESRRKRSETIKAWWARRKAIEDIVKS
nr:MAG TPA: intron associated endonuclease [Crassvirales sp.]